MRRAQALEIADEIDLSQIGDSRIRRALLPWWRRQPDLLAAEREVFHAAGYTTTPLVGVDGRLSLIVVPPEPQRADDSLKHQRSKCQRWYRVTLARPPARVAAVVWSPSSLIAVSHLGLDLSTAQDSGVAPSSGARERFLRRLRQAREDSGMTQAAAARALRKPQSFISKCETGERRVEAVELKDFARVYRVSVNYFLD